MAFMSKLGSSRFNRLRLLWSVNPSNVNVTKTRVHRVARKERKF